MMAHNTQVGGIAPVECRAHHFLPLFLLFWVGLIASFEPLQHLCPQGFWRQYLKAVQRQNGSQLSWIILELNIKNLLR